MSSNMMNQQNNIKQIKSLNNNVNFDELDKVHFPVDCTTRQLTTFLDEKEQYLVTDQTEEPQQKLEDVKKWVEESEFDITDQSSVIDSSNYTSSVADSTAYTSSVTDTDMDDNDLSNNFKGIKIENEIQLSGIKNADKSVITTGNNQSPMEINQIDMIQQIFNGDNSIQSFGNIEVNNSSRVHIGNIIHVTGPIHITHTGGGSIGTINQTSTTDKSFTKETRTNINSNVNSNPSETGDEIENIRSVNLFPVNRPDIFVGKIGQAIDGRVLKIVNPITWLAQPPLETEPMDGPVPFVIISHTATELTTTQAETVYLVRNIQTYHIESRNWHDIGYSFLIGGDGNVYEGRGWKRVGAHTYGYNKKSIGISFVGCFMNSLPPDISLKACKLLIKKGLEEGHIAADYKLLAHCQCSATESPGKRLFEEIKTWHNWVASP